jgi:hypothetical protein
MCPFDQRLLMFPLRQTPCAVPLASKICCRIKNRSLDIEIEATPGSPVLLGRIAGYAALAAVTRRQSHRSNMVVNISQNCRFSQGQVAAT